MARPKKHNLDTEKVEQLAGFGCTNTEIASFFGCSKQLISDSYCTNVTKGKADLKKRLRKAQIDTAISGNATMLVWLGKQMLNQTDRQEIEHIRPIDEVDFNGI